MRLLIIVLLFFSGCVKVPPTPIILPQPIEHHLPKEITLGGKITRELYRSFWVLPSRDSDHIHLGIIPSESSIEFYSKRSFRIRVHEEHQSWDIFSPQGVLWQVTEPKMIRPALIRYFATIENQLVPPGSFVKNNELLPWIAKGYRRAQWVGPPKMDAWEKKDQVFRYFLSLQDFYKESEAQEFCKKIKKETDKRCTVISRVDLPMFGEGRLVAKNSNFEKSFQGILELIPNKDETILISNVQTQLLHDHKKTLSMSSHLYILPNNKEQFTLVQAVSFQKYLEGVLPSEIFPNAPLEALSAQAIIARTYALSQLWTKYSLDPFLTCITTQCQAYYGNGKYYENISKAVAQTQNMVLKQKDHKFAQTFYHASSGGITENKHISLGGERLDYLGGTKDILKPNLSTLANEKILEKFIQEKEETYCSISSFSNKHEIWTKQWGHKELIRLLGQPVQDLIILHRGISGRATQAVLVYENGTKEVLEGELTIRRKLGALPSSMFTVHAVKSESGTIQHLTLQGRGRGHGVGLSQQGAIGRAQIGQNYKQILQAYYPGTLLDSIIQQK